MIELAGVGRRSLWAGRLDFPIAEGMGGEADETFVGSDRPKREGLEGIGFAPKMLRWWRGERGSLGRLGPCSGQVATVTRSA